MPFFSRVFKGKDSSSAVSKSKKSLDDSKAPALLPPKPRWEDAWTRREVAPAEVQELIHLCTQEIKSRVLDIPFLLLPFRPEVDQSAARSFIRNYFRSQYEASSAYKGDALRQELLLTEPMVLCSIMKWCWSRIPGGVVTWDAYNLFRVGEQDSNMARHAFHTFIPLSVDSDARKQIILDFFDLLAAIAAHSKANGLSGRKLSRMAGWWAFELSEAGNGFDGGYKSWASAADAACHLFFAYLRSKSPESLDGISGLAALPRSLQALLSQTEYPPEPPVLMQTTTTKVVMIVDCVSPTPFALLRRSKHFQYRDDDRLLQVFSSFEDPTEALTDECKRVLRAISSTNQSNAIAPATTETKTAPKKQDPSWSRFEDIGFTDNLGDYNSEKQNGNALQLGRQGPPQGVSEQSRSRTGDFGRPTTPSWADFLNEGFQEGQGRGAPVPFILPPDKVLPPLSDVRVHSSQSHVRHGEGDDLEPGELASINRFDLDDAFWWVWIISLASEETAERKSVFGRCALIETMLEGGRWLLMEEQVKGAGPGPEEGAYIAEKKSRNPFSRRGRLARRKSTDKKSNNNNLGVHSTPYAKSTQTLATAAASKTTIGPDQHARIQAAAAKLAQEQKDGERGTTATRRARMDDAATAKTNSVMTLQPLVASEAGPAMKWAKQFDKGAIRSQYLGDKSAGTGKSMENLMATANGTASQSPEADKLSSQPVAQDKELPATSDMRSPSPNDAKTTIPEAVTPTVPPKNTEAAAAAEVALPPPVGDEKPLPAPVETTTHPALRIPEPESHVEPAQETAAQDAKNKTPPKKLKKKEVGGASGFKKVFGRKNKDTTPKTAEPTSPQAAESKNLVPEGTVARKLSLLQKKDSNKQATPEPTTERETTPRKPVASEAFFTEAQKTDEQASKSEFDRFAQGPLEDNPAFAEDDVSESSVHLRDGSPAAGFQTRAAERLYNAPEPVPASEVAPEPVIRDNRPSRGPSPMPVSPIGREPQSSSAAADPVSSDDDDAAPAPSVPNDRWAQIRKNAAERAQRAGDEPVSPAKPTAPKPIERKSIPTAAATAPSKDERGSMDDNDGETSGEETIESRVARIKARVAELTGNMDQDGKINTGPARQ